jgi:hypothetical protein
MAAKEHPRPIMVGQGVGGGNRVYPTFAKNTNPDKVVDWDDFDYVNGEEIPDDYHDIFGGR